MESENKPESEIKTGTEEPELTGYTKTLILSLLVGIAFAAAGVYLVSLFPNGIWVLGFLLLLIGGIDLLVYIPFGVIPCLRKEKGIVKEKKESKGPPKALKIIVAIAVIVSTGVLIFVAATNSGNQDKGQSDSYGHGESAAWSDAKQTVTEQLKSPSSARFCARKDADITLSDDRWTVSGYVDADNSFGTSLRNSFTVVIEYIDKDSYRVISCDIY